MQYGKGPSGIIDSTLNESAVAIWALSLNIRGQLKNDLEILEVDDDPKEVACHKEKKA